MKLGQVKMVLDDKIKELNDTYAERSRSLIDTYRIEKGSHEELKQNTDYEYTVDELTGKADKLEYQILVLSSKLTQANCGNYIDFTLNGEKLTLQQGIKYIKSLRCGLNSIKRLGDTKEIRRVEDDKTYGGTLIKGYTEIEKPTYNTREYRDRYVKNNKLIQKLEVAISEKNFTINIDIPESILE